MSTRSKDFREHLEPELSREPSTVLMFTSTCLAFTTESGWLSISWPASGGMLDEQHLPREGGRDAPKASSGGSWDDVAVTFSIPTVLIGDVEQRPHLRASGVSSSMSARTPDSPGLAPADVGVFFSEAVIGIGKTLHSIVNPLDNFSGECHWPDFADVSVFHNDLSPLSRTTTGLLRKPRLRYLPAMVAELVRVVGSLLDITQVADGSLREARARAWLFREKTTWGVGGLDHYLAPMSREVPGFELGLAAHVLQTDENGDADDDGVLFRVLFVVRDGLDIINEEHDALNAEALIARRSARDLEHANVLLGLFESRRHVEIVAHTPKLLISEPVDPPPLLRTPAMRGGILNVEFDLD